MAFHVPGHPLTPGSHYEPPVFIGNLLNQNLLERAYRFPVLFQAVQQAGELSLCSGHQEGAVSSRVNRAEYCSTN